MELSESKIGEIKGLLKGIRQIGSGNEDIEKLIDEIERIIIVPSLMQGMPEVYKHLHNSKSQTLDEYMGYDSGKAVVPDKDAPAQSDTRLPCSGSHKFLAERIATEPRGVIEEIKAMWAYLHKGVSISDSASGLSAQQLICDIQSLSLGHGMEQLSCNQLSELLGESPYVVGAVRHGGDISEHLNFRLAEVFGWKGRTSDAAPDSRAGKAPSGAKVPEVHDRRLPLLPRQSPRKRLRRKEAGESSARVR